MNAAPKTLRHLSDLQQAGLAPVDQHAALAKVAAQYAVAITPAMAALIDRTDPHDPIALQLVPDPAELNASTGETADPIGDRAHSPVPGVVHRYPDRVLLKLTGVCAVYCRFCFRREMVGPSAKPLTPQQVDAAFDYIEHHPEIWEVILSGGDPLVLSARRLRQTMEMFERTFAMFAPFARKASEAPGEADKEPKPASGGGDIEDLKRQIDEMQKRLDRLSDKS